MESPNSVSAPQGFFAEPTPLGLLGLAVGCSALVPIAFGWTHGPAALRTAGWICLVFGGGCQFLAGLMALSNKNLLGGTLFTTFAFNWVMNYVTLSGLSEGRLPDPGVGLSVDVCFLLIFVPLTYAFGFYSKLLFLFLLDIDSLYILKIAREVFHLPALGLPIAWATVLLAVIALWLGLAILVNQAAGRSVIPVPGPLFKPAGGSVPGS